MLSSLKWSETEKEQSTLWQCPVFQYFYLWITNSVQSKGFHPKNTWNLWLPLFSSKWSFGQGKCKNIWHNLYEGLISHHPQLFTCCYPEVSLPPKFHYAVHFSQQILRWIVQSQWTYNVLSVLLCLCAHFVREKVWTNNAPWLQY